MSFKPATKEKSKLRLALMGPSGSGKTFTALTFAGALGKKIAVIDSERGSASKYADLFKFDVCDLDNHAPATYVSIIKEAEKLGYDVLIIDSLSHAWAGKDGALEQVDKVNKRSQSGNSFAAWREVTPMHNNLVDAILQSKCHVIATMRTKQEYVLEENEKGRKVPRKVGMAPVQREGVEYEFDVIADMNIEHDFIIAKTRCHLLDGLVTRKPGVEVAETMRTWLEGGVAPDPKSASTASGQTVASGQQTSSSEKSIQTSQSPATSASNSSTGTAEKKPDEGSQPATSAASQAGTPQSQTAPATQNGASADPKSTGTQTSNAGSGTTTSATASSAEDDKSFCKPSSDADRVITKDELGQLLKIGIANGWKQADISNFVRHTFKMTAKEIATSFTWKQWEAAVKLVAHPKNANGKVTVNVAGKPLTPEQCWPAIKA